MDEYIPANAKAGLMPPEMKRTQLLEDAKKAAHEERTMASRPYPQFMYQVAKARGWLEAYLLDLQ